MISPPRERTIRFCNAVSPSGMYACELERGHTGRHRSESFSNPPYHEWSSE
jgi:hypothetical protein